MTYKMTLADGTVFDGLQLNGNNYISQSEITSDQLTDEALKSVAIEASDGTAETLEAQTLVQVTQVGSEHWFIIRGKTAEEVEKAEMQKQLDDSKQAVMELTELVAGMMA